MNPFDRHCNEIVAQAGLFAGDLVGADVSVDVASCPGWNVSQLARHVDGGLRWAADIVGRRATEPPPDTALRDLSGATGLDPDELAASIVVAADMCVDALREAGPEARMWCPVPGGAAAFYARRFAHETAIHRADAVLALGLDFVIPTFVAVDGIEEWLELGAMPFHFDVHPWMRELLGADRRIGLHAKDTGDDWVLDFTGEVITWRRGRGEVAAAVQGSATDLLLVLYRRKSVDTVAVTGDAGLVDFWLERVAFG